MFLVRGIVFSHEAVREWEAKLTPALERLPNEPSRLGFPDAARL
jgi:transposase-like protein